MAVGNLSLTSVSKVLKKRYESRVEKMRQERDPFFKKIAKDEMFNGEDWNVSLVYNNPQGGSADLGEAIDNRSTGNYDRFTLTRRREYHVTGIDAEAMHAAKDEGTVLKALDEAMDGGLANFYDSLEIAMWNDGTGRRGNINATVTGTTVTLTEPSEIFSFFKDMFVQFAAPNGGALRDSGEKKRVVNVNYLAGTFTVDTDLNTISGLTSGDDIVRSGDRNALIQGIPAWLPLVRSGLGTPFNGVTRSDAPEYLAGIVYGGEGAQKLETLGKAVTLLSKFDSAPASQGKRVAVVSIDVHQDLAAAQGSTMQTSSEKDTAYWGFNTIVIRTPRGDLPVISSLRVPDDEFYVLRPDTWVIKSLKKLPHLVDDDGLTVRVGTRTDDIQWRYRAYANMACRAPGYNLHGVWGSLP